MKITAEQHQKNLESLATLTPEMMDGMTVVYLRKLLAGVNIYNIKRGEELVRTARARKEEIVTAIYEMTTKSRVLAQVELTELSQDDIRIGLSGLLHSTDESLVAYSQKLFEDLRAYTQSQWDSEHGVWKMDTNYPQTLSLGLYVWLEGYRTSTGEPLQGDTKVVYASRIRNSVKKLINSLESTAGYLPQLTRHYEQLKSHNVKLLAELNTDKRVTQKERATYRQGNSQAIDPTQLLERAKDVLTRVSNGESVRWYDVSIALVLVTGRRPSEVHATAKFTAVDDEHVTFSGQLKKKDAHDSSPYTIPTLVKSSLVITGHEYIKSQGKFYTDEPERAHTNVSTPISKYAIKPWYKTCLPNVKDYTDDKGRSVNVRTHYRMREIYALVCLDRYESTTEKHLSASDKVRYIASILGHEDNSKAYEAYDANFYIG